mgnify:CR=1 FL=1
MKISWRTYPALHRERLQTINTSSAFFQKDQTLIAILDLIFDYPKPQVAYIGLFMLDVSEQGKGTGSNIMKGVFKQLANQGNHLCASWLYTRECGSCFLLETQWILFT